MNTIQNLKMAIPPIPSSVPERSNLNASHAPATHCLRQIVVFQQHWTQDLLRSWQRESAISRVAHTSDFQISSWNNINTRDADLLIFDRLGVALLNLEDQDQLQWIRERTRRKRAIESMRPESRMSVLDTDTQPALPEISERFFSDFSRECHLRHQKSSSTRDLWKGFSDSRRGTWAIHAIGLTQSRNNGSGSKIAILDTGIDFQHPDWQDREIFHRSFVGKSAQDDHGHGTQCAGLACGHPSSSNQARFGAAPKSDLYVAKVLESDGSGPDSAILAGIDWAMGQGCHVLSLSVGVQSSNLMPDPVYETVAQRCLKSGMLFIAAAGNDSHRPNLIRPVCRPANCHSIFAVAAVDRYLRLAPFSNGTAFPGHCQIDGVAPGVDVLTTNLGPKPYSRCSGTSMAAPICAGVAAAFVQEDADCLGNALWQKLSAYARRLMHNSTDVGNGLICFRSKKSFPI
ncbi:MAG: hypothetical protein RJA81_1441 [Planctomycetota bacterium]